MRKILAIILFLFILLFKPVQPSFAVESSGFNLKTDTTYQLLESNLISVSIHFTLVNLSSEKFASQYIFNLKDQNASGITVSDSFGTIPTQKQQQSDGWKITIPLKSTSTGAGVAQNWTVSYLTPTLVQKSGDITQIDLPPGSLDANTTDFKVKLIWPQTFQPIILKPITTPANDNSASWSKSQLKSSNVYIALGKTNAATNFAAYDFKITYHLQNSQGKSGNSEIPLPPDTNFQKVLIKSLIPRPLDVTVDADGNWLAKYYLGSKEKLDVVATGSVALFSKPQVHPFIAESDIKNLTGPSQFWETSSKAVRDESGKYASLKDIFFATTQLLTFNKPANGNVVKRQGAQYSLLTGSTSSGQDYSDLFIALARARGVPTREISGILINSDPIQPIQSWVQYFQKETNSWQMADPSLSQFSAGLDYFSSWDFRHFTLAIHGAQSYTPSLTQNSSATPTISVVPAADKIDPFTLPQLELRPDMPPKASAGFAINGKIFVDNNGPTALNSETVTVKSDQFNVLTPIISTGILPPFASRELNVSIRPTHWLDQSNGIISIGVEAVVRQFPLSVAPIYKSGFILSLGGLIAIGTISLIAQIARSLFIQRRK